MKKLTMRNTVAQISAFLTEASKTKAVKSDKDLIARMLYTSKAIKKGENVAKADLLDLANDCFTLMAAAEVKPTKESSLKRKPQKAEKSEAQEQPKPSKSKKTGGLAPDTEAEEPKTKGKTKTDSKQNKQKPEPKQEPKSKAEPKSKPSTKKGEDKKQPEKKAEPKAKAFEFPEELIDEDDIKYVRADDLNSYEAVKKAVEDEEEIVFATHWTEAMLKTGLYGNGQIEKKSDMPKAFKDEVDLLQVIYVGELLTNIFTISMFTDAEYYFMSKDFKKGIANNLRFAVYRVESEEE